MAPSSLMMDCAMEKKAISNWCYWHDSKFSVLQWSLEPPDLNPNDHIWEIMERECASDWMCNPQHVAESQQMISNIRVDWVDYFWSKQSPKSILVWCSQLSYFLSFSWSWTNQTRLSTSLPMCFSVHPQSVWEFDQLQAMDFQAWLLNQTRMLWWVEGKDDQSTQEKSLIMQSTLEDVWPQSALAWPRIWKCFFKHGKKERETEIFVSSSRWFTIKGSYLLKVKGESMLLLCKYGIRTSALSQGLALISVGS